MFWYVLGTIELLPVFLVLCLLKLLPRFKGFDPVRDCWIICFRRTAWLGSLAYRAQIMEVGLTGHVSCLDRRVAALRSYRPLNRFERWLLKSAIDVEREYRQNAFRQTCIEQLGEDPADWI